MGIVDKIFNLHKRSILTLTLFLVFVWSMLFVEWDSNLIHPGGSAMIGEIVEGFFQPNLDHDIILIAFESSWITLAYAAAGMTFAIIYAFIAGVLASGVLFSAKVANYSSRIFFRGILGFTRAIHELVWAWLFVAAIGLSPYAAIFALAIPYGGILGRVFADMLNDVPKAPILALKNAGASRLQCLFYGYIPLVRADIISYTMYRFECAIRSSAIMSFVGLGGLGYQIQLSLADLKYDEVWTFVFFLILLVLLVDLWSLLIRKGLIEQKIHMKIGRISVWFSVLIMTLSWWYIYVYQSANLSGLFTDRNLQFAQKFFTGLLGMNEDYPAFTNAESWEMVLGLTFDTLIMSIMAIGIAAIFSIITVIPASRNVADGSLTSSKRWYNWPIYLLIRISYVFSRAVPELVWALLIVFILKPGLLPGAIALALHNIGILGKLWAETIENIDARPIRNLASSGASKWQQLFYGVIPVVMPKFLTYLLYRWEVIMRTTIVVGFVGAGGLGLQFKLSMSFFHYSEITLILICYLLLVFLADLISETARKTVK